MANPGIHVGAQRWRPRRCWASSFVSLTSRRLLEEAGLGELAAFAELGADGALEVVLAERGLLLGGEEGGAQCGVADVAARHLVAPREVGEVELAGERQLLGEVDAPQLLARLVVGEREGQPARQAALEGGVDRGAEGGGEHGDALEG